MALQTDTDRRHLARAIDLAQRGRGRVSPNPMVGAVLGRDHEILGEGFHASLGGPHAEVEAIAAAGDQDLDGATLYVSLEPCCHQGRTAPCTDAIRDAGIRRVVVASDDPSEHANGRGLGILRDEGVEVVIAGGVGDVQGGDDAGRKGRDSHRGLAVDLRIHEPRARPPLAGRVRRGRGRSGYGFDR